MIQDPFQGREGMMDIEITLRYLSPEGDTVRKGPIKTLVADKVLTMDQPVVINGKVVHTWDDFFNEVQKTPAPEAFQLPVIIGG